MAHFFICSNKKILLPFSRKAKKSELRATPHSSGYTRLIHFNYYPVVSQFCPRCITPPQPAGHMSPTDVIPA